MVEGEFESWRQIVASNPEPRWKFVQPNSILHDDGRVELRIYEENSEDIIQSFSEKTL